MYIFLVTFPTQLSSQYFSVSHGENLLYNKAPSSPSPLRSSIALFYKYASSARVQFMQFMHAVTGIANFNERVSW